MRHHVLGFALTFALAAAPAAAIDVGTGSGRYAGEGTRLANLTHAVALSVDNAEGQLEHPSELRVLISQEEAPASVLAGLAFTPAHAMARAGALHGLLLTFDPKDRSSVLVTVLAKPGEPGQTLANITLSNTGGVWKRLEVNATRAVGELKPPESSELAAAFEAPVFTNPVQQDLKGPAAAASEPVKVLTSRMEEAIGKGDMAGAAALSTKASAEQLAAMPPAVMKQAKAQIPSMVRQLKAPKRVVIRKDTAAIETADGSWFSLAREGGAWKAAD